MHRTALLDLRVSRPIAFSGMGRIELILDVSPTFGQPTVFIDPRRVMLGVRLNLGR